VKDFQLKRQGVGILTWDKTEPEADYDEAVLLAAAEQ